MAKLVGAREVERETSVDRTTLLRWERQGIISPTRTSGGHRRYDLDQIATLSEEPQREPDVAEVPEGSPDYTEWGVTGLRRQGGSVYEERLREMRGKSGRVLKRQMRMNDPVIAAVFFGISNAMKQAAWRIVPASERPGDKRAKDFIEQCLFKDMSWSWNTQLAFIIDEMLEQGFALNELVYKKRLGQSPPSYSTDVAPSEFNDGRVGWRKWAPRPADSLASGQEWIFDDHGGIQGIRQQPETWFYTKLNNTRTIPIHISKLLHFRTTPHPANNPEGMAIHRPMWKSYWFKTNIEELEGIGIERDLAGIPVIYLGDGTTKGSGANTDYTLAKEIVTNLRNDEQAGVVIPHSQMNNDGKGVLLELLSTGSRRQYDTNEIISRYNKVMAMSVLAQFLFLGMERVGSYALVRYQGDLFTLAVTAWLTGIADVINRHAIPKLLKFNTFDTSNGYPKLVFSEAGVPDLENLSKFVNGMVNAQVLTPTPELERSIRQLARFPQEEVEDRDRITALQNRQQPFGNNGAGNGGGNNEMGGSNRNGNED